MQASCCTVYVVPRMKMGCAIVLQHRWFAPSYPGQSFRLGDLERAMNAGGRADVNPWKVFCAPALFRNVPDWYGGTNGGSENL